MDNKKLEDLTMKDMLNYTKKILTDKDELNKYLELLKKTTESMRTQVKNYEESLKIELTDDEKKKIEDEVKNEEK